MQRYLKRVRHGADEKKEKGAAVVEFAVALPIFIALLLLIFDAGLGYSASRTSSSAARSAARIGALAGDARNADYQVLQSLRGEFASFDNGNGTGAEVIIIYNSSPTNANGVPPTACFSASSVVDKCNRYDASILNGLTQELFTDATVTLPDGSETCDPGAVDAAWCPLGRRADDGSFLGVYISSEYDTTTGLESAAFDLEDRAVFALYFPPEPVELPDP